MANDYDNSPTSVMVDPSRPIETPNPVFGTDNNTDIDDDRVPLTDAYQPGVGGDINSNSYDSTSTGYRSTDYPTMNETDDPTNNAYPNRGVDHNSAHDPAKGATIGAIGGAIVGGLAGGPVGAVVGGVAGAAASGAGVAAVDQYDDDNSPGERHADPVTGEPVVTGSTDLD